MSTVSNGVTSRHSQTSVIVWYDSGDYFPSLSLLFTAFDIFSRKGFVISLVKRLASVANALMLTRRVCEA